jgi:hypothetical protein
VACDPWRYGPDAAPLVPRDRVDALLNGAPPAHGASAPRVLAAVREHALLSLAAESTPGGYGRSLNALNGIAAAIAERAGADDAERTSLLDALRDEAVRATADLQ